MNQTGMSERSDMTQIQFAEAFVKEESDLGPVHINGNIPQQIFSSGSQANRNSEDGGDAFQKKENVQRP